MGNSSHYPSSSLNTVSTLRLVIGHRVVPLGTSHLWLPRVLNPQSSASVLLSLLFGARNGIVAGFLPPHLPDKPLMPGGAVSAPKGSLRAGSAFFAGLLQPLVFFQQGLGVVAANITSLASGARFIIWRVVYLPFPIHPCSGYFLQFTAFGKVFKFLALCLGLSTAPQVFTRVMAPVWSFCYTVLVSASALSARLTPSGILPGIVIFLWGRSSGCATLLAWSSIGRCLSLWRITNHFSLGVLLASLSFRASPAR